VEKIKIKQNIAPAKNIIYLYYIFAIDHSIASAQGLTSIVFKPETLYETKELKNHIFDIF